MMIYIDTSDLKRIVREIDAMRAKIPQAIARGLNEGGDKVRTQVQRALQKQTGLVRYASVTSRIRTARAFPGQADASAVAKGSAAGQGMQYQIIVTGKPTKRNEFKWKVTTGKGGGVTIWMWGKEHKFKRSFQLLGTGLRMRTTGPRFPIRGFDGPNLAKEAVKDEAAHAFFKGAGEFVGPAIEKHLAKALKG